MSDSEAYLRELRRALPVGCRRRLDAEVREHFASAVAAEAKRGVPRAEAERLTVGRLGPAHVLADQLLDDLRSGALGHVGRLAVALTMTRLVALATVSAIAVVLGVVLVATRWSSAPPAPQRSAVSQETAAQTRAAAAARLAADAAAAAATGRGKGMAAEAQAAEARAAAAEAALRVTRGG